jgi:urease accessory protein
MDMRRDCLGAMVLPMWGLCMVAGSAHAHGGPGPAQAATWFSGLVAGGLEAAIAASVAALGVLLLGRAVLPRAWCMGLVAAAALLHGMAHGLEWDPATPWLAYGAGFTLTTALLHLGGLGLGLALQRMHAAWLRVAGMGIGGAGLAMLLARA